MVKISGIGTDRFTGEQKFVTDFCIDFFMRDKQKLVNYLDNNVIVENIGRGKSVGWTEFENIFDKAMDIKAAEIEFDHVLSSGTNVSADGQFLTNDNRWLSFMFVGEFTHQAESPKFKFVKLSIAPSIA